MAEFPPTTLKEDSKYHEVTYEDSVIRQSTEGGYQITRPRYTKAPSRVFKTGFTRISDQQKTDLENFYATKNYGASTFTYDIPTSGTTITVKFQGPLKFKYVGIRNLKLWDVSDIMLREE